MQLAEVTPLILTFNEAANIRRTLEGVSWASRIVVIDSYSTDETLSIAREFEQVAVFQRPFDHFADQCMFGLEQVRTPWTLSLDADYVCTSSLAHEIVNLDASVAGYKAGFRYCINGYPLRSTLYPPRTVLYRTELARYCRDGHAHRVMIDGNVSALRTVIDHDDRKPHSIWLGAQLRYAEIEAEKLLSAPRSLGWKDWIRRWTLLAPSLTFFYTLVVKGLILDGRPGIFYALQRTYAELLLSLVLLDRIVMGRHDR